jgi:hypothetical protein
MGLRIHRRGPRVVLAAVVLLACVGSAAYAGVFGGGAGNAVTACAKQANGQLRVVSDPSQCLSSEYAIQLAQPQPPPGPQNVTVDCGAGQSINQAIQQADPNEPLTIKVQGTCTESVSIRRDQVTVQANAPGDGINAPAGQSAIQLSDARNINLVGLTLAGGQSGVSAGQSATFQARGLHISGVSNGISVGAGADGSVSGTVVDGATNEGMGAHNGGVLTISGGTITNVSSGFGVNSQGASSISINNGTVVSHCNFIAVYAAFSGSVDVSGATIEDNHGAGVLVGQAGSAHLWANNPGDIVVRDNAGQGVSIGLNGSAQLHNVVVSGNTQGGVLVSQGGTVQIEASTVEHNQQGGVAIDSVSSGQIDNSLIEDNQGDGLHVSNTSVPSFGFPSGNNTITGNSGWGVICTDASHTEGAAGTVSGNGAGQVNCP